MKGRNIVLVAIVVIAIVSFLYVVRRSRETFDPKNAILTGPRMAVDIPVGRTIVTTFGYIFATQVGLNVIVLVTDPNAIVVRSKYYFGTLEELDARIGEAPYSALSGLMSSNIASYSIRSPYTLPHSPPPDLPPLPPEKVDPPPTRPRLKKEDVDSKREILSHNCVDCIYDEDGKMRCNCKMQRWVPKVGAKPLEPASEKKVSTLYDMNVEFPQ
jgi:hypothetical protein